MIIYLHKNIIKKLKRNEQLIASLYTQLLAEEKSYLILEDGPYTDKICAEYGLIFDLAAEANTFVLWDQLEEKESLALRASFPLYERRPVRTLIASNQFIELTVTTDTFEQEISAILHSNQLELNYILDEEQSFILQQSKNFTNIAYTGNAGSGKTLLLNRIAHDLMYEQTPFLYLTFTDTLKEKFASFLSEELELFPNVATLATFEQFLRKHVAAQVGIDATHYVTFFECERFVHAQLPKLQQSLNYKTLLSVKECARILLTIPTFELDIEQPNAKWNTPAVIIQRKLKSLQKAGATSCTKEDIELLCTLAKLFDSYLKKEKKQLWHIFLNDLNRALQNTSYMHAFRYILLDEMQDLGQFEYMLLIKLLGNSHQTQYIMTYDENQRIAFEGSTDRSFGKRIQQLDLTSLFLKNNYRNAATIKQLAQTFLTEPQTTLTASNISASNVKVVLNPNLEHLLRQLSSKFIPEENLNIGIVAFGQTYSHYYHHFYTAEGKRKYVGIDFYNEEDIKGLEYTNLIILNFFELCQTSKPITAMELRKWYVAITRACDNLLIHAHSVDEYEYVKHALQQPFFEQEHVQLYTSLDDALDQFTRDILVSLGSEQKTILAQEGVRLLQAFKTAHDMDAFDEAVSIFELLHMQDTLKNLLELDFSHYKQQGLVALQLCKLAITAEDDALYKAYIPYVDGNHYWQLMKMLPPTAHEWLKYFKGDIKSEAAVKGELNEKGKALKMQQQLDEYIRLYYTEGIYANIIHTYEEQSHTFQKSTYKMIAKAYVKQQQYEKAANLYLQHGFLVEFMQLFTMLGQYELAFQLLFRMTETTMKEEYVALLYTLAIKPSTEREQLLQQLLTLKKLPARTTLQVYYELFLLRKEQKYAKLGIELAVKHKLDDEVLLFYTQDHSLAFTFDAIAQILQKNKRFRELSQLYHEQERYGDELVALVEAHRHGAAGVETSILTLTEDIIHGHIDGDFGEVLQTMKQDIYSLCTTHEAAFTEDFLLYVQAFDEAITLAYNREDFKRVIEIATNHAYSDASTALVAQAYEKLQQFDDAIALYKKLGRHHKAIMIQPDAYRQKKEIHRALLRISVYLSKDVAQLKEQRLARFQALLQTDFEHSSMTNFPLFIEQTIQTWFQLLGNDIEPRYALLQDSPEAAERAICYLANHAEKVISYYKQFEDMPYSEQALETILQAAIACNVSTEEQLAIRQRLLIASMASVKAPVNEQVIENVEAVFHLKTYTTQTQYNQLLKLVAPAVPQTSDTVKQSIIAMIYALQTKKLQPEDKNLRDAQLLLERAPLQLHLRLLNALTEKMSVSQKELIVSFSHVFAQFLTKATSYAQAELAQATRDAQKIAHELHTVQTSIRDAQQFITVFDKLLSVLAEKEAAEFASLYADELEQQFTAQFDNIETGLQRSAAATREEYELLKQIIAAHAEPNALADMRTQLKRRRQSRTQEHKKLQLQVDRLKKKHDELAQIVHTQTERNASLKKQLTKIATQYEDVLKLAKLPAVPLTTAHFEAVAHHPVVAESVQTIFERIAREHAQAEQIIAKEVAQQEKPIDIQTKPVSPTPAEGKELIENMVVHSDETATEQMTSQTAVATSESETSNFEQFVQLATALENENETILFERVRVFYELLQTDLAYDVVARISRLPHDFVAFYKDEQDKVSMYLALVKSLDNTQLELLSQLQAVPIQHLIILRQLSLYSA